MFEVTIKNRRTGQLKAFFDQVEEYYKNNPDMTIMGPNSPYNKYEKTTRNYFYDYYDEADPWPIPIQLAWENPKLYFELVAKKKKVMAELWNQAKPVLSDKSIGKIMVFGSMGPESTNEELNNIFYNKTHGTEQTPSKT